MSRPLVLTLLTALALLPACGGFRASRHSVTERNGQLFLGDVLLDHHQEVPVADDALTATTLVLECPTGVIDIVGLEGAQVELVVDLYTEIEGDGVVTWDGGRLVARSQSGGAVLINGIRGRVPADMGVSVDTGTGQVALSGLTGGQDVRISTGTGPVRLGECELGTLTLDTGTGDLRLESVQAHLVDVDSGTGELTAQSCQIDELIGNSGTGDFRLTDCQVGRGRFDSGTGDVRLMDSMVQDLHASLGAGDVITRNR